MVLIIIGVVRQPKIAAVIKTPSELNTQRISIINPANISPLNLL